MFKPTMRRTSFLLTRPHSSLSRSVMRETLKYGTASRRFVNITVIMFRTNRNSFLAVLTGLLSSAMDAPVDAESAVISGDATVLLLFTWLSSLLVILWCIDLGVTYLASSPASQRVSSPAVDGPADTEDN